MTPPIVGVPFSFDEILVLHPDTLPKFNFLKKGIKIGDSKTVIIKLTIVVYNTTFTNNVIPCLSFPHIVSLHQVIVSVLFHYLKYIVYVSHSCLSDHKK